ncbi:MAG: hypothetical protein ACOC0O_06335 [Spirochaetota bacterium]
MTHQLRALFRPAQQPEVVVGTVLAIHRCDVILNGFRVVPHKAIIGTIFAT